MSHHPPRDEPPDAPGPSPCQDGLRPTKSHRQWPPWMWIVVLWPILLVTTLPLSRLRLIGGDEGIELTKAAHLLRSGSFDDSIWNDQPMTHTRLYALLLHLAGGAAGPRWWSVAASAVLVASLARITQCLFKCHRAAFWSALLFVMTPQGLELSVSAMQEVPSAAFGLLSVSLAAGLPAVGARRGHLLLASTAAAISTAIKLTGAMYGIAAVLFLTFHPSRARRPKVGPRHVHPALLFLVQAIVLTLLLLMALDGRTTDRLLGSHLQAFLQSSQTGHATSASDIWTYLARDCPQILLLSILGACLLIRKGWPLRRSPQRTPPHWLILPLVTSAFNLSIRPWWPYYTVGLWAALCPLGAYAIAWCQGALGHLIRNRLHQGLLSRPALWLSITSVLLLASAVQEWLVSLALWRRAQPAEASPILAAIRQHRPAHHATATIYASDASYAFWSGLPVPPDLLVVTQKRILSGDLNSEDIPSLIRRHRCDFVLTPQGLDPRASPPWRSLLVPDYALVAVADGRELHVHHRLHPKPWSPQLRW